MFKNILALFVVLSLVFIFSTPGSAATYKPEYKLSLVVGPQTSWGQSRLLSLV